MATTETTARAPKRTEAQTSSRLKRGLTIFAAAVVAIGAAYGVGRFQGRHETEAVEQKLQESEKQKAVATGEFDAQRDRAIRLEARRRIQMALAAVDDKNFGIAQQHLYKAATLLERSKGLPALDTLAADLKKTEIPPGAAGNQNHDKVLGLMRRFDEALPPPEP